MRSLPDDAFSFPAAAVCANGLLKTQGRRLRVVVLLRFALPERSGYLLECSA